MILPDLIGLFYAYNPHMPQHPKALAWWTALIHGDERFPGLSWKNPLAG
jgi:hypothetical protein